MVLSRMMMSRTAIIVMVAGLDSQAEKVIWSRQISFYMVVFHKFMINWWRNVLLDYVICFSMQFGWMHYNFFLIYKYLIYISIGQTKLKWTKLTSSWFQILIIYLFKVIKVLSIICPYHNKMHILSGLSRTFAAFTNARITHLLTCLVSDHVLFVRGLFVLLKLNYLFQITAIRVGSVIDWL